MYLKRIYNQAIYQPYFIWFIGITIALWSMIITSLKSEALYFAVSLLSFLLTLISSLPVFSVWKYFSNRKAGIVLASYAAWALLVPIVWIAVYYLFINIYSIILDLYASNNIKLHVTLWSMFVNLIYSPITSTLFTGMFLYISIWLSANIEGSSQLKLVSVFLTGVSGVLFALSFVYSLVG